ncbi:MAG: hypothetical protein K1Y36_29610 [Blastocatellia bacterium]|nr:hypothetical protein [Blastocatellia bacterium]
MVQLSVPSPPETVETFAQALLVATRICRGENPARMAEIGAITTIE